MSPSRFFALIVCLIALQSSISFAEDFYYTGDGCLKLKDQKTGSVYKGCYRKPLTSYDENELKKLDQFFGVPKNFGEHFSLRTISLLDYLEDQYAKESTITITSSYRDPKYNEKLRKKKTKTKKPLLVGKTSYHMDAMALDVVFPKVITSIDLWKNAKKLNYGGVGYYEDNSVHIDSGKPRSWNRSNAIDSDEDPQNKSISISVDRDIYKPEDTITMFFSGITNYPFGVETSMSIFSSEESVLKIQPTFTGIQSTTCQQISDREQARKITWLIPEKFETKNKKLHFKVKFCLPTPDSPVYEKMPKDIDSREFEIR